MSTTVTPEKRRSYRRLPLVHVVCGECLRALCGTKPSRTWIPTRGEVCSCVVCAQMEPGIRCCPNCGILLLIEFDVDSL